MQTIIPYDEAFLRTMDELVERTDADDPAQLYRFIIDRYKYLFRLVQYYGFHIAPDNARAFDGADADTRRELMRPLSFRQYRMVQRSFSRDTDEVIRSLWDFLDDEGRIAGKTVMSTAEVCGASLIYEQICCRLASVTRPAPPADGRKPGLE